MNNDYYVYIHSKLDGTPFYVGKGRGDRAYVTYPSLRSKFWHKTVKKHGLVVKIVDDNLTESLAFELEKFLIEVMGRRDLGTGPLVNLTGGGDGAPALSPETRKKKGKAIAATFSAEKRAKYKEAASRLNSPEARAKSYITQRKFEKPVVCATTGQEFASLQRAAEWLVEIGKTKTKCGMGNISACANGRLPHAYGYEWVFAARGGKYNPPHDIPTPPET